MRDIRLFIDGKEVEFSSDPNILFNYKETDLHNPTIVKNTYSKSLTLDGTPQNNDIFGNIYDLERIQFGSLYNPMNKAPFELYLNGELIENGYVRLDKVIRTGKKVTYSVTLYGGLGDFFYNLSYQGESEEKKTLASLSYKMVTGSDVSSSEPDLDFDITKEEVDAAWKAITGTGSITPDDRWNVINFIPCYNGIPSDFDANKVIINNKVPSGDLPNRVYDDGVEYYPLIGGRRNLNGYTLGEMENDLTEWETFDLRSYLQRPAVSVYRTLTACGNPENNGGYEVDWDTHFADVENPYWFKGWMTLPMLQDLDFSNGTTETLSSATITNSTSRLWNINYSSTLSSVSNIELEIGVNFTPTGSTTASVLHPKHTATISTGAHIFNGWTYVKKLVGNTGVIMQMWALDNSNNIVAASDAYFLGEDEKKANKTTSIWSDFYSDTAVPDIEPDEYRYIYGNWVKSGSTYTFCDGNGNPVHIKFSLKGKGDFTKLQMKIKIPNTEYVWYAWNGQTASLDSGNYFNDADHMPLYTSQTVTGSGNYNVTQARALGRVLGDYSYIIHSFTATATDYEAFFSGTRITKDKLLSTPFTPAEFLLSYAKLFGLYFYHDPAEKSASPQCPNGVIHIMDRDTFFDGKYINLEEKIDHSREMNITPVVAGSKWFVFNTEQNASEANDSYKSTYGYDYGRQIVNTNYNFDNSTTNLYDGNVFKGGVMVREKDKYYYQPDADTPQYVWNGLTVTLYNKTNASKEYDTVESAITASRMSVRYNLNTIGLDGYDLLPKLQCHGTDNSSSDGEYVLMFYRYHIDTYGEGGYQTPYCLTDDTSDMIYLNDGTPCWIMPLGEEYDIEGKHIAISVPYLPFFSRYEMNDGMQEGHYVHTWDFGRPLVTFVPNTYTTEGDCIYDKCWKSYVHDLYSVNGRKLSCYVNLQERPTAAALRHWYWFDNSIWRLNAITEWNAGGYAPTKCEFVKVQDVDNYALGEIRHAGTSRISVSPLLVPATGGSVTYTIVLQDCSRWWLGVDDGEILGYVDDNIVSVIYSTTTNGSGCSSTLTVSVPANNLTSAISWKATFWNGQDERLGEAVFTQEAAVPTVVFAFVNDEVTVNNTSATYSASFTSSEMQTATITGSSSSQWLTVDSVGASSINYSVTANDGVSVRSAVIDLYGTGNDSAVHHTYLTVLQTADVLTVSPTSVAIDYDDVDYDIPHLIDIRSNNNWTITIDDE